jgi:hypothetical protein
MCLDFLMRAARGIYPQGACIKKTSTRGGGNRNKNKGNYKRLVRGVREASLCLPKDKKRKHCNKRFYEVTDEEIVTLNGSFM